MGYNNGARKRGTVKRGRGGIGSFAGERTRWVKKRACEGAETRRIANECEQVDYVSRCAEGAAAKTEY